MKMRLNLDFDLFIQRKGGCVVGELADRQASVAPKLNSP
jgi:hypothetical protein